MKYFEVLKVNIYKIYLCILFCGSQGTGDISVWSIPSVPSGTNLLYTVIVIVHSTIYAAIEYKTVQYMTVYSTTPHTAQYKMNFWRGSRFNEPKFNEPSLLQHSTIKHKHTYPQYNTYILQYSSIKVKNWKMNN